MDLLTYPSISICKKYSISGDQKWNKQAVDDINMTEVVGDLYWGVYPHNDQFYFFTHPGVKNMSFPCTTLMGGTTPGTPCVFPFIYDDKIHQV